MKLKYCIVSLFALAFTLVSCQQEADHYLSAIKVSTSYVSLPAAGGDVTLTLTAESDWAFSEIYSIKTGEKDENGKDITVMKASPEWLTIDPLSGQAGENVITLHADETADTQETVLEITCAGKTQIVNVIQMTQKVVPAEITVKEAVEMIKADQGIDSYVRVRGIVCKILEISPQYGNATFFISDDGTYSGSYGADGQGDGNWLEVYRCYWLDNTKFTTGEEFSVGDELLIAGNIMSYKGTPETKQGAAYVEEYTPSLIQTEAFDFEMLPAIDTTFEFVVTAKVSPLLVTSDASWLQITGVSKEGAYVLHADANDYTAVRTANILINGPGAVKSVAVKQAGIPATGASVTDIVKMADESEVETLECTVIAKTTMGVVIWDGETALYVYGNQAAEAIPGDNVKVFGLKKTYNGVPEIAFDKDKEGHKVEIISHGNPYTVPDAKDITEEAGTYAATQAEYVKLTGTLSISGSYYNLALEAFGDGSKQGSIVAPQESLNADSYEGKSITVTGWFNGLSGGGKYINIIATKIVEYQANAKGSLSNPYTASEMAMTLMGGTTFDENVYVKGIISDIRFTFSADFDTATFWISDDGTAYGVSEDHKSTTEPTKDFMAYSAYLFGVGNEWEEGNKQVAVGDEVILCGKVTCYNGTVAETVSKQAFIYSLNGATE
ncbi:MAG: BACON domain-containing protein [Bacteroidales bacterium]|nr:BACON domain-containing protein [Bacteroidales bacterium]